MDRLRALSLSLVFAAACGNGTTMHGGGPDGSVDGARGDGASGGDGATGDGSSPCGVTVTGTAPPFVTQGSTGVMMRVTGSGFGADVSVSVDGMPATVAGGATATKVDVTVPDGALAATGDKTVVVTSHGCSVTTHLLVRSPDSLAVAGWPRHHHDNQNSSVTSAVVAAAPTLRWSHPLGSEASGVSSEGGGAWSAPVTAPIPGLGADEFGGGDEVVWDGAPDGTVFSWLAADGTQRFHFTMIGAAPYGIDSVPAVRADGTLYVGISDSTLYALSPAGARVWGYDTRGTSDASAIVTEDGTLLYASDDGHVYALHSDGTLAWDTTAAGEVDSAFATSPQVLGDLHVNVYYAGGSSGFFALDPTDGHTLWSIPATGVRGAAVSSPVVSPDGSTIYTIDTGGHATASTSAGTEIWHADFPAGGGVTPALLGDTLYAVFFDGHLRAVDAHTGAMRWDRDVHVTLLNDQGELPTPSIDGHGTVYVFSDDGNVYAFDADGTPHAPIAVCPARVEFLVPQLAIGRDGTLYVAGTDDVLYALR